MEIIFIRVKITGLDFSAKYNNELNEYRETCLFPFPGTKIPPIRDTYLVILVAINVENMITSDNSK